MGTVDDGVRRSEEPSLPLVVQAVEEHHSKFSKVMLLGKIIAGDVDDALWQYALQCEWLMANHPRAPSWQVRNAASSRLPPAPLHPQSPRSFYTSSVSAGAGALDDSSSSSCLSLPQAALRLSRCYFIAAGERQVFIWPCR